MGNELIWERGSADRQPPETPPESPAKPRRSNTGLWLVLLVCLAPVLLSYFTYYVIRPESRKHFGELIMPQRSMPQAVAWDREGQTFTLNNLRQQWLLVSVSDRPCDASCEQQLYLQRQLRESMGRDKDRMDRVWLVTDWSHVPDRLWPGLQGATVLKIEPAAMFDWLQAQGGHGLSEHLYVVDPMGNWMMRFPAQMDNAGAARALKDMHRLLRATASWDQPGRPEQHP